MLLPRTVFRNDAETEYCLKQYLYEVQSQPEIWSRVRGSVAELPKFSPGVTGRVTILGSSENALIDRLSAIHAIPSLAVH
jgi:hypothetical protein